eukprot:scaffold17852_cov20-Tisochrysis_lutea.AAC.1
MGVQVKLSEAVAGNDWTWRFPGDGGEVVSEKGAKKRTVTGGCTLDCRALPALVTDQQSGQTLGEMKDPPRSGFTYPDGTPRVAAFRPHPTGGFTAEFAAGWMKKVVAPCFEEELKRGEHVLGLCDGFGAHMSPEMIDAALE